MKTWNDYKAHAKSQSNITKQDIEETEALSSIVSALIQKRTAMGISQRELAAICGVPQSSVARIESFATTPKLDTLIKLMQPLGLRLSVSSR